MSHFIEDKNDCVQDCYFGGKKSNKCTEFIVHNSNNLLAVNLENIIKPEQ